jgi:hypothetical protein
MAKPEAKTRLATCNCGKTVIETKHAPILTVDCYCESCQKAAQFLQSLPGAAQVLNDDGGTSFVLHRKDRLRCFQGQDTLRENRLTPDAKTRRVVAACCNSAMFLEFTNGHWLSLYKARMAPSDQPATGMRVMTMDRKPGVEFNDNLPSYEKHNGKFMWRLLSAWAAMGFRAPKLDCVKGEING